MEPFRLKHLNTPLVIAGPCSAETREQTVETCAQVAAIPEVTLLRAGLWKPRTRPDSFEGVGREGLSWLNEVQRNTGKPVCTEVADASHVESCLEAGMDALWIGARTTVNPFSVQAIADALKGVDIPIFIKNPINPDVKLWIGAVERIRSAGIEEVGAIHRGFSYYGSSIYRNQPRWELALAFQAAMPDVLLLNDPSHISGKRALVEQVASRAMSLGFEGLMIESHIDPSQAWSDAAQQVTPQNLGPLLDRVLAHAGKPRPFSDATLSSLRSEMDGLDEEIISLLAQRMAMSERIGDHKATVDLEILQPERWQEILSTRSTLARQLGLSPEFILDLLDLIHEESIHRQENVFDKKGKTQTGSDIPW